MTDEQPPVICASATMKRVLHVLERAAASKAPVVLVGPSGVGKERLARWLHSRSERANGPFVAVACGAVPEGIAESLFFGHVRGAFSGAERDTEGHFLRAHHGTLFLDDVSSMSLPMQARLLRALDSGEVQPVGGEVRAVDVRLVVASQAPMEALVAQGSMRADLCYRLSALLVDIPPLRARPEDLTALIDEEAARHGMRFTGDARAALLRHDWPGNAREVLNTVHAAAVFADDGHAVQRHHLPERLQATASDASSGDPIERTVGPDTLALDLNVRRRVQVLERALIAEALRRHGGNRRAAARTCGLSPRAFLYKLRAYGLDG